MPRDNDTDSNKEKRMGERIDPYASPKKRMLNIRDVPNLVMNEGKQIIAIPSALDKEATQIIQLRQQDVHEQKIDSDNVQILERMVGGCKNQLIALTEDGMLKLQQRGDQTERERACAKWQLFLKAVWETIHGQITERMQEMGTYIDQDVRNTEGAAIAPGLFPPCLCVNRWRFLEIR